MDLNKRKKDEDEILDTGVNNYPNLGSKDTVKKLAEDYANYNYDTFTEGDSYKALEKRYQAGGQKAMQDTVGQVSARTGGLASSYATVAGQQTYNDWMGNLEDAARALYDSERQEMGDRYALANSMYLQERDEQWRQEDIDDKNRLEGEGKAYNTVVALINAGTPIDEIDPALIEQTGYDPSHFYAMAKSYTDNQTKDSLQDLRDIMDRGGTVTLQQWLAANGTEAEYEGLVSINTNSQNANTIADLTNIIYNGGDVTLEQWKAANGDEATYNSIMSIKTNAQAKADEKTTKEDADAVIQNYIDAFGTLDGLDESWFGKSSKPKDYWTSEAQKATNSSNQNTLAQYMVSLSDGVFVDRQAFIDAGGDAAVYDAYKKVSDDAKAKDEAKDKATLATNTLNTLIKTRADVDWDSEEIQQLIKDSGRSPLEWDALIAQMNEDIQAEADAEAAAEIATAEASAANDVIMYLVGGTKTLDELEASGMLASTGQNRDWWEGYIAYRNKINPQEVEKAAEFYDVDYETVRGYMAYMDEITTENEAIDFKELVARATGNQGFADELYMRWLTMHSDIAVS